MEQPTTTTTATTTTHTTTTTYSWGIGHIVHDAYAGRCNSRHRERRWIMGHVWQFCSNFADDCCHNGGSVGAGGGDAVAGAVGVSPKLYEPNCRSKHALHATVTHESTSTYAYWQWCTTASSPIHDRWICAAAAAVAASWNSSRYTGFTNGVLQHRNSWAVNSSASVHGHSAGCSVTSCSPNSY